MKKFFTAQETAKSTARAASAVPWKRRSPAYLPAKATQSALTGAGIWFFILLLFFLGQFQNTPEILSTELVHLIAELAGQLRVPLLVKHLPQLIRPQTQ